MSMSEVRTVVAARESTQQQIRRRIMRSRLASTACSIMALGTGIAIGVDPDNQTTYRAGIVSVFSGAGFAFLDAKRAKTRCAELVGSYAKIVGHEGNVLQTTRLSIEDNDIKEAIEEDRRANPQLNTASYDPNIVTAGCSSPIIMGGTIAIAGSLSGEHAPGVVVGGMLGGSITAGVGATFSVLHDRKLVRLQESYLRQIDNIDSATQLNI